MPGHALAALAAYPELSCDSTQTYKVSPTWGVFEQVFCPSETTFKFFEGVMDEVIELFPSEYIHIGGDECPKTAWKNSAFCQQLIRQLGLKDDTTPSKTDGIKHSKEDKLQSYFVTRMEKYLNGKGRNIIGWDEILEGGLAPNATVMSWRGVEGGMNAAKAGHNAIMTPNPYVYLDYYQEEPEIAPTTIGGYNTLKKTYSYNPVPDDADELAKKHIIGIQGNIWREYMQTSERTDYQAFPRAMAIAETAWTQNANKDWKNFCERMVTEFERLEVMNTKPCLNFFDVNVNTHADENAPLMVLLESFYPNAEIRYTTDGSEPNKASTLYEKPFVLEGNIDLKAAAFKDGKMLGKVAHKPLYGNLLTGKPYTVNYKMGWTGDIFDENDVLGADKTTFGLTNGKRGNNASYTPWCSFGIVEGKDLEFIVNLDKPTQISKIIFGSLFNPAMRILPAGGVAVEVSADGKQYTPVAEKALKHDYPETGRIAFTDSIEFEPTQATFLKVKIKNGGTLRNGVNFEKNNGPEVIPAELWIDETKLTIFHADFTVLTQQDVESASFIPDLNNRTVNASLILMFTVLFIINHTPKGIIIIHSFTPKIYLSHKPFGRKVTFCLQGSLTSTSRSCNSLTIMRIGHISCCKNSGHFRTRTITVCNNITYFVRIDILFKYFSIRLMSDSQEETVDR